MSFKMVIVGLIGLSSLAAHAGEFKLSSATLKDGGNVPMESVFNSFGCTGKNVSPELSWTGAPAGAKSFAVTAYDPDAPTGSGWWHWVVFNLPPSTHELKAGAGAPDSKAMPAGAVQARTDFGKPGYGGPCPPPGKPHHYIFTVYALKEAKLPLEADASGAMVGFYLHQASLGEARLTALFGR